MPDDFDAQSFMAAAAAAVGLEIAPPHRPGVLLNLQRIAAMAQTVMEFPLPDDDEPAPVFRP